MRKKLSLLIALAISLSISTTSLAAELTSGTSSNNAAVVNTLGASLTLDQILNNVETSSIEIKAIDKKIDSLNKQYNNDKMKAISIDANNKSESQYKNGQYAQIMVQKEITPAQDLQNIEDQKNTKEEKLNNIKFDLQKQYMNAITAKKQIDNINSNIANLDEEILQLQAKISLGQATQDVVNPLYVQKSKLLSQLAAPNTQLQQCLLNIKKYLNMDLTASLTLSPAKKDYTKFDDSDIVNKINDAVKKDYSLNSINKNIDIQKIQVNIQTKYAYDSIIEPENSKLTLQDLQNKVNDTATNLEVSIWKAYYTLKNKEDSVQAQLLSQEAAQMSYDKAKQSLDNGMIDKVALASAELALNNQKVATEQAINDYMITQEQFKYVLNGHGALAASIK